MTKPTTLNLHHTHQHLQTLYTRRDLAHEISAPRDPFDVSVGLPTCSTNSHHMWGHITELSCETSVVAQPSCDGLRVGGTAERNNHRWAFKQYPLRGPLRRLHMF